MKHILEKHPGSGPDEVRFDIKVLKTHRSPFERQIYESAVIQTMRGKHHLLNSRSEYNRCALPRLGIQLGEKEFKRRKDEDQAEKEKEEDLERRIKELKRGQVSRRRGPATANSQPSRKKVKLSDGVGVGATSLPSKTTNNKRKISD